MPLLIALVVIAIIVGLSNEQNNDAELKAACIQSKGTIETEEYSNHFKSCKPAEEAKQ